MRLSIDLDGVLADMDSALAKIAGEEFGVRAGKTGASRPLPDVGTEPVTAATPPDLPTAAVLNQLTARQQARLWQRVRETRNFWEGLTEHEPGTIRRLQDLAYQLSWDVLFFTQRPPTTGRTVQVQSQRWLHKQGFDLPAVYTTRASRGRIAAALTLDAHIDDRIEHAVDIATESPAWSILVWRDEPSFERVSANARKLNIAAVRTVGEALDKLDAADRGGARGTAPPSQDDEAGHTGSALISRLKRAFLG